MLNQSKMFAAVVLIAATLFSLQTTAAPKKDVKTNNAGYQDALRFFGAGVARAPDTTRGEPADANWCFDAEMQDAVTGRRVGDGVDCLKVVGGDGIGIEVIGTTFFNFDNQRGNIVSQGMTTVQPVLHGSEGFTHITGAIPQDGDNNVISGTRTFRNATGPVRLSGAVNMSEFNGNFGDTIFFSCLFILDLKKN